MVDRRIVAAGLGLAVFGAGWATHALVSRGPDRPSPLLAERAAPAPPPPASAPAPTASTSTKEVFDDIYRQGKWGHNSEDAGSSGFGSMIGPTLLYRTFLEHFMKAKGVRSVVDAGCGDWEFSRAIDWSGIDYKGYDIVESVIVGDNKKYAKPNVQFFVADIVNEDLPAADLLISKNVLQHLPTADVQKFLKQLREYEHVLLVDGVDPRTLAGKNEDIAAGEYRDLDLTRPPFNLRAAKALTYWDGGSMQQVVYVPRQP